MGEGPARPGEGESVDDNTEPKRPCWQIKDCKKKGCYAYGKNVDCFNTPGAGLYGKKSCRDGPMCGRLKQVVCPGCPVFKERDGEMQS